jgi:phosphoserine aminotransferase
MSRAVYNFSPGPATLPESVLRQAASEMLDWNGTGVSVMEMSHRGKDFLQIHAKAQADLRELLAIPDNYKILFLQGGGSQQFMQVPCNLLGGKTSADYIVTGEWTQRAIKEAARFCEPKVAASTQAEGFTRFPKQDELKLNKKAAYVYYCMNETVHGVESFDIPHTGNVPLVSDISSTFLSRPLDVSRFGLIYGGAQKNIGPAGLTMVIVREDLLGIAVPKPPSILDYSLMAASDSMLNTPPCFAIYMAGLVFEWLKSQGGLAKMQANNIAKANLLYSALDESSFYRVPVQQDSRSRMNVVFFLPDERLNDEFIAGAKQLNLVNIKGHKVFGGMRASIYNAMPIAGVQLLANYLREFAKKHG